MRDTAADVLSASMRPAAMGPKRAAQSPDGLQIWNYIFIFSIPFICAYISQ